MAGLILFHKPFRVLSQFTDTEGRETLADYLQAPGFRVAGRLDYDSEGLLLLTDDGLLQQQIANPRHKQWKVYHVQVEGMISEQALGHLRDSVVLKDGKTLPAKARKISEPDNLFPREPPVRVRKSIPDSWLELAIREGRNRQVRRMTAAVDHPTLRLIRQSVAHWSLEDLAPGEYRSLTVHSPKVSTPPRKRRR